MGEFEFIEQIFDQQASNPLSLANARFVEQGIGDDGAVITPPIGQKLIVCTDTLVQGRHFADDWASVDKLAFAIGYKAVMVNLSDLASMGATPHSILLALALPQRLAQKDWLARFAKGLFAACDTAGVLLIGGDTTKSDKLIITITAQGFAPSAVYRHHAQVGDDIYVSGTLGDAGFALANLAYLGDDSPLLARLHLPKARTALGIALRNVANAMMDISDGLAQDLGHLLRASQVGAKLDLDKLPTSAELHRVPLAKRLRYQLTGGDDYELLFTAPKGVILPTSDVPMTKIGTIIAEHGLHLYYHNTPITRQHPYPFDDYPDLTGWVHF